MNTATRNVEIAKSVEEKMAYFDRVRINGLPPTREQLKAFNAKVKLWKERSGETFDPKNEMRINDMRKRLMRIVRPEITEFTTEKEFEKRCNDIGSIVTELRILMNSPHLYDRLYETKYIDNDDRKVIVIQQTPAMRKQLSRANKSEIHRYNISDEFKAPVGGTCSQGSQERLIRQSIAAKKDQINKMKESGQLVAKPKKTKKRERSPIFKETMRIHKRSRF